MSSTAGGVAETSLHEQILDGLEPSSDPLIPARSGISGISHRRRR